MGAGIEDAVAVKALQYRRVPPIANLREPDPDLGELHLSEGGHADIDYAQIVRESALVVDCRNATRGIVSDKIFRL